MFAARRRSRGRSEGRSGRANFGCSLKPPARMSSTMKSRRFPKPERGSLCMTSVLEPPSRGTPPGRQIRKFSSGVHREPTRLARSECNNAIGQRAQEHVENGRLRRNYDTLRVAPKDRLPHSRRSTLWPANPPKHLSKLILDFGLQRVRLRLSFERVHVDQTDKDLSTISPRSTGGIEPPLSEQAPEAVSAGHGATAAAASVFKSG